MTRNTVTRRCARGGEFLYRSPRSRVARLTGTRGGAGLFGSPLPSRTISKGRPRRIDGIIRKLAIKGRPKVSAKPHHRTTAPRKLLAFITQPCYKYSPHAGVVQW